MKENILINLSKEFALSIIELCSKANDKSKYTVLFNQLMRSGTSVGANIHEANYASSKADFINKFQIALKKCYESDYWVTLLKDSNIITEEQYQDIYNKCSKIRKLLISSINTAKSNQDK